MKFKLFLVKFCFIISLNAASQTTNYTAVEMSVLDANSTDQSQKPVKVNYKATLNASELHIYSPSPVTIYLGKAIDVRDTENERVLVFQCKDKNINCKLMISHYKKSPVKGCYYRFVIMYNNKPQKIISYLLNEKK